MTSEQSKTLIKLFFFQADSLIWDCKLLTNSLITSVCDLAFWSQYVCKISNSFFGSRTFKALSLFIAFVCVAIRDTILTYCYIKRRDTCLRQASLYKLSHLTNLMKQFTRNTYHEYITTNWASNSRCY